MTTVTRGVLIALLVVLAISLGANYWLTSSWLQARDRATKAEERETQAAGAARSCGNGVKSLQEAADAANLRAAQDRKDAATARAGKNKKADAILSTPATVPGDQCKSADDRFNAWLGAR